MQLLERAKNNAFLGQEFLVWLWFKSDIHKGTFSLGEAEDAELRFDGRVVLQSDDNDGAEKVICLGENSHLREARFALTEYKNITEAMLKLVIGDNEWSFILDSTWMNFKSFKTPKVIPENHEDPEGVFYEKFLLIEKALSAMETIFSSFIKIRVSPDWASSELPALLEWIREGK